MIEGSMRIPHGRVPSLAAELVGALVAGKGIDVDAAARHEVELDIASVLSEYARIDREITEQAKEALDRRGLGPEHLMKARKLAAADRGFEIGDEASTWVMNQIIEVLMQSNNVAEVYGEDHDLKRLMKPVFARQAAADEEIEEEVRKRIKNISEGTASWDIEYKKALAAIRRARGIGD
jgi:hypothetical protein